MINRIMKVSANKKVNTKCKTIQYLESTIGKTIREFNEKSGLIIEYRYTYQNQGEFKNKCFHRCKCRSIKKVPRKLYNMDYGIEIVNIQLPKTSQVRSLLINKVKKKLSDELINQAIKEIYEVVHPVHHTMNILNAMIYPKHFHDDVEEDNIKYPSTTEIIDNMYYSMDSMQNFTILQLNKVLKGILYTTPNIRYVAAYLNAIYSHSVMETCLAQKGDL